MMVEQMDGSKNVSWMKHDGIHGIGNYRKKSEGNPGPSSMRMN